MFNRLSQMMTPLFFNRNWIGSAVYIGTLTHHRPKQLIVFDWAGTLVDLGSVAPVRAFQATFSKTYSQFGLCPSEYEINQYMGMDKKTHLHHLTRHDTELTSILYPLLLGEMKRCIRVYSRPVPGSHRVLRTLFRQSGNYIGSTSGYSRELLDIAIETARYHSMFIPYSVASDEVERPRPFPDMIDKNREFYRGYLKDYQEPLRIVKVGDTVVDIQEGVEAEASLCIGITMSPIVKQQMKNAGATHVVSTLEEILPIVEMG